MHYDDNTDATVSPPTNAINTINTINTINSNKSLNPHKFFRSAIPVAMLYDFVHKISYKLPNTECYLIDRNAYKKAIYCPEPASVSAIEQFCSDLMPYYCKEKQVFLTRKMSYNNLNTILRQVCRHCAVEFRSERKYDKSKTHIVYYVAMNDAMDSLDM
jgi:hypothetical protein